MWLQISVCNHCVQFFFLCNPNYSISMLLKYKAINKPSKSFSTHLKITNNYPSHTFLSRHDSYLLHMLPGISLLLRVMPGGWALSKWVCSLCRPCLNLEGLGGTDGRPMCMQSEFVSGKLHSLQFLHRELLFLLINVELFALLKGTSPMSLSSVCDATELSRFGLFFVHPEYIKSSASSRGTSRGICDVEHDRERAILSRLAATGWNVERTLWWLDWELPTLSPSSLFTESVSLGSYSWLDRLFSVNGKVSV